ncbi:hypothetical protein ADL00_39590 [Streptomyces sp. AS58]|uniref:DUF2690 domain-containing protein n=1 Tax=Streptomyces cadmiisoli TaxID=2184053 RepID=A0A2Z4J366_9ACTN|nr:MULTISPECIES: hypothetical protein [Streptomyces]AWW39519.1 hypothetical protein DN051_25025 [Streptomyces cadmiisoli]KOV51884.1 hypothetical protein ADL00_39590 [Streptomyces sp. AS58]
MFNSKKIAAVAGFLGSVALVGVGAVQAHAVEGPGNCVSDGAGKMRCVEVKHYEFTTESGQKVELVHKSTQNCPTSHSQVSCVSNLDVSNKKS